MDFLFSSISFYNEAAKIEFETEELKEVMAQVLNITKEYSPKVTGDIEKIKIAINELPSKELEELAHYFIIEKKLSLAGKTEAETNALSSKELLSFVVINSIKPFVKTVARGLKDLAGLDKWTHGYCPVCGWQPLMGKVANDNKRVLHCSLCDFEWSFKRLKCTECGNENHETLQHFTVSGEEGREVHICDECKAYLKVVNTKELILEKDMTLEDVKTIPLDMLAKKEGYHKK